MYPATKNCINNCKLSFITFFYGLVTLLKKCFFDVLILLKIKNDESKMERHEITFVTVLVVAEIIISLLKMYNHIMNNQGFILLTGLKKMAFHLFTGEMCCFLK